MSNLKYLMHLTVTVSEFDVPLQLASRDLAAAPGLPLPVVEAPMEYSSVVPF